VGPLSTLCGTSVRWQRPDVPHRRESCRDPPQPSSHPQDTSPAITRVVQESPRIVARITPPVDGHNTTRVSHSPPTGRRSGGRSPRSGRERADLGNHRNRPPNHTTDTSTARSSRARGPSSPDSRPSAPQLGGQLRHAHTGAGRHDPHPGDEFAASCPLPAGPLPGRWTPRVNRAGQSGETTETSKTHHPSR
jgi:hypothetical protein